MRPEIQLWVDFSETIYISRANTVRRRVNQQNAAGPAYSVSFGALETEVAWDVYG